MIVFVSGEGATDIGKSDIYGDGIGPMTKLIEFMIKENYSNIEYKIKTISRSELGKNRNSKPFMHKGKKNQNLEKRYFFKNVYCLSKLVKNELRGREAELLLVVFFRDSDTIDQREWREKYESIVNGFKAGQCECGVPMLPKTSSEVWLLSSVLKSHKIDGKHLEDIGDRNHLKEELRKKINNQTIRNYDFDFTKISDEISSYKQFTQDLDSVLKDIRGQPRGAARTGDHISCSYLIS